LAHNIPDPFAQFRSAPAGHAPWRSPTSGPPEADDYFATHQHPPKLPRPVSPLTALPISEVEGEEEQDQIRQVVRSPAESKSSSFLKPPEIRYGSMKKVSSPMPLRVDTSGMTLTAPQIPRISREISRESSTPSSPLGFRDSQEPGSLMTSLSRKTRYRWWPYFLLPDPHFLYVTLFPTIHGFRNKSWSQRVLAIIAVPAVLVFTVTLPVVDTEADEQEDEFKFPRSPSISVHHEDMISLDPDTEDIIARSWNRWLTGVQCIFAPIFLTYLFFRTSPPFDCTKILIAADGGILPILYALLAGLTALALLLVFSSPTKPPKWHNALCAVGFIVSTGWISTIADEVVGILRAFGAILGVSEAILGVTVFAVVCPFDGAPPDIRATRCPIL